MFIKKNFKKIFIYFFIFLISFYFVNLVNAADEVKIPNPVSVENFEKLINKIIDFIFALSLGITPLMLIIAGFYYIFAAGETKNIQTAHDIVKWTLIGFIVILMSKGIINFLIKNVFK